MLFSFVLLVGCISVTRAALNQLSADECTIPIAYAPEVYSIYQPLYLTTDTKRGNIDFLYPRNGETILRIPSGTPIRLACTGPYNYLKYPTGIRGPREVTAVCLRERLFTVGRETYQISSLKCRYVPQHMSRRTPKPCLGKYRIVQIGFRLDTTFLPTVEVCWEDERYTTHYTKFRLTKAIESYQRNYPRPTRWWVGDFYPGLNVEKIYQMETQLDTVARILNSTEIAKSRIKKYVQYLSRGHLTAKADFVYGPQQRSTFWYINAAPQWQSFNGGNWNTLEENVRHFAASRQLDLDVYTGVHGQMTMTDAKRRQQPIHLHYEAKEKWLPAPKFYWKVIYDPISKRGTAFIGLNDPFIRRITESVYICNDISSSINWLTWDSKNILRGVSYACTVPDLQKVVRSVPPLNVVGVLA